MIIRENLSYSEKAYSLYQHYTALKSQWKWRDLVLEIRNLLNPHELRDCSTSSEFVRNSDSHDGLVEEYNLSKDKLSKYIRIGESIKENLMELFDKKYLSLSTAYLLSFIVKEE